MWLLQIQLCVVGQSVSRHWLRYPVCKRGTYNNGKVFHHIKVFLEATAIYVILPLINTVSALLQPTGCCSMYLTLDSDSLSQNPLVYYGNCRHYQIYMGVEHTHCPVTINYERSTNTVWGPSMVHECKPRRDDCWISNYDYASRGNHLLRSPCCIYEWTKRT